MHHCNQLRRLPIPDKRTEANQQKSCMHGLTTKIVNAPIRRGNYHGVGAMDCRQRHRYRGAHFVLVLMIGFALGFFARSIMWQVMILPSIPGNGKDITWPLPTVSYLSPPQGDAVVASNAPIASWSRGLHTVAVNNDIVYGHVHMTKTAGSEINGLLASRYERVCGNKGNSYDYYQTNARYAEARKRNCTTAFGCIQDAATPTSLTKKIERKRGITEDGLADAGWTRLGTRTVITSVWRTAVDCSGRRIFWNWAARL